MKRVLTALSFAAFPGAMLLSVEGLRAQAPQLPDAPAKDLVTENCGNCHGVDVITVKRRTAAEWDEVMSRMVANGAVLTDDQTARITAYLNANLGKNVGTDVPAASAAAPPAPKPSGPTHPGERG